MLQYLNYMTVKTWIILYLQQFWMALNSYPQNSSKMSYQKSNFLAEHAYPLAP